MFWLDTLPSHVDSRTNNRIRAGKGPEPESPSTKMSAWGIYDVRGGLPVPNPFPQPPPKQPRADFAAVKAPPATHPGKAHRATAFEAAAIADWLDLP